MSEISSLVEISRNIILQQRVMMTSGTCIPINISITLTLIDVINWKTIDEMKQQLEVPKTFSSNKFQMKTAQTIDYHPVFVVA